MNKLRVAFAGLLVAATVTAAPVPAERAKAEKELAAVAAKLHGEWLGGDCVGRIAFHPNGSYEWTGIGPGSCRETGNWSVRGEAPAFALVLKCTDADDLDRAGKMTEVKIVQLDDTEFVFKKPEPFGPLLFERIFIAPQPHAPANGAR